MNIERGVKKKRVVNAAAYVEVAVALPTYRTYTYAVSPEHLPFADVGKRVLVPFGPRAVTGYTLGETKPCEDFEIKPIADVLDEQPLFPLEMVPFFRWVAQYYFHPLGEVIKNALPGGLTLYDFSMLALTPLGMEHVHDGDISPMARRVLSCLAQGMLRPKALQEKIGVEIPRSIIHELERKAWIEKRREFKGILIKPKKERWIAPAAPPRILVDHASALSHERACLLRLLAESGPMPLSEIKRHIPKAPRLVGSLIQAGLVRSYHKRIYRDPLGEPITPDPVHIHTPEQQAVIAEVCSAMGKGAAAYLLDGVTGSGKTEVYMKLVAESLRRGGTALVLVPEIALISQMERAFRSRFGSDIAVLHSALSPGERLDQWTRIARRQVRIAIGARSAIFAPFENPGLIIVDEEHDASYKQENRLRYNARDLAMVRGKLSGSVTLLGSASPSLESVQNVALGKYRRLVMTRRAGRGTMPEISLVDLKEFRHERGMRRFITPDLQTAVAEALSRKEQVMLFLNRRGYAGYAVCAACGSAVECEHCDISLTYHQSANAYRCHYCGYSKPATSGCPGCGGARFKNLGLGTEKVEAWMKSLFPEASVMRMDRDTTTRKGALIEILKALRNGAIDILVGTQMIAKGHDFPNITVVGIICADLSLNFPDFRAGERTFQLISQVAGRAGRGQKSGRVILQTYAPAHYCITSALNRDFKAFYDQEAVYRKSLDYPPYTRLVQLGVSAKKAVDAESKAKELGRLLEKIVNTPGGACRGVRILGPVEAPLAKVADRYRWQILLKSALAKPLQVLVSRLLFENGKIVAPGKTSVTVDVDPFSMM